VESVALAVLRALEDQLMRDGSNSVAAVTTAEAALYILNNKRSFVTEMEQRYGVSIAVKASDRMQGANFAIERSVAPVQPHKAVERSAVNMEWAFEGQERSDEVVDDVLSSDEERGSRRSRRRRRRGRRDERPEYRSREERGEALNGGDADDGAGDYSRHEKTENRATEDGGAEPFDEPPGLGEQPRGGYSEDDNEERRSRRGRRRGRRGGRRGGRERDTYKADEAGFHAETRASNGPDELAGDLSEEKRPSPHEEALEEDKRAPQHHPSSAHTEAHEVDVLTNTTPSPNESHSVEPVATRSTEAPYVEEDDPIRPARKGWWQRRFSNP
jgi:ribonuclease E